MKETVKKTFGKILNILSIVLLIAALGLLVFVATNKFLNKTPQIFGYSFHFVVSDSMEDEINIGDLVVGKKTDISDIKAGDDVIFVSTDPSLGGKTIVHRVRSVDDTGDKIKLYTYGIKYNRDDSPAYPVTQIIGKAVKVSGFWGKVFNPMGIIFVLLIMGSIFIFYFGIKYLLKARRELSAESALESQEKTEPSVMSEGDKDKACTTEETNDKKE